jgi:hypothetical protein
VILRKLPIVFIGDDGLLGVISLACLQQKYQWSTKLATFGLPLVVLVSIQFSLNSLDSWPTLQQFGFPNFFNTNIYDITNCSFLVCIIKNYEFFISKVATQK